MTATTSRIETLDALRGLAALAVCWFHLTRPTQYFATGGVLEASGRYGYLGVEVFFVISGFIIPYTLWRAGYRIADYRTFVAKRIVRLDPPYLVCIALVIALAYLSALAPGYRGAQPSYSWGQVLSHLGYLNLFFNYPWINLVFWTLAIEFQYYLFIGLYFPLLTHHSRFTATAALLLLGGLPFVIPQGQFVFKWLLVFLPGILTFRYRAATLPLRRYLPALCLCAAGVYCSHDAPAAVATLCTALLIAFVPIRNRVLNFLGEISFSVYLLHVPVGGRVVNLAARVLPSGGGRLVAALVATAVVIVVSYLFYRLVERPAQRWSSRLRFHSSRRSQAEGESYAAEPG